MQSHLQTSSNPRFASLSRFLLPVEAIQQALYSVFTTFCSFGAGQAGSESMDSSHLMKLCRDAQLLDTKLTRTNVDLIFTRVCPKGSKRLNYKQFVNALTLFAEKKRMNPLKIFMMVVSIQGPSVSCTVANPNRFHDDKTTYTGVHTQGGPTKHDNGITLSSHMDRSQNTDVRGVKQNDRVTLPTKRTLIPGDIGVQAMGAMSVNDHHDHHEQHDSAGIQSTPFSNILTDNLNPEQAKHFTAHDLEEHLFEHFCTYNSKTASTPDPQMDSAAFVKWNRDLQIVGKGFTTTDCDLIFQKSKAGGNYSKRITFTEFRQVSIPLIAQAKRCSEQDLLERCLRFQGKVLRGTVAQYNKFHDDKATYTGVHTKGGPSKIDNVVTQEMLGNRSVQADIRGVPILQHNKQYTHGEASHGSVLNDGREGKVSERSERALMKTSILAMNPAKWLQTGTSTTKLTHSIILTRFIRFALASLKMHLASLGAARHR